MSPEAGRGMFRPTHQAEGRGGTSITRPVENSQPEGTSLLGLFWDLPPWFSGGWERKEVLNVALARLT